MNNMVVLCDPPVSETWSYAAASFETLEEARDAVPAVLEMCENNDCNDGETNDTHGPSVKKCSTVNDMKARILVTLLSHKGHTHRNHVFPESKFTAEQIKSYKKAETDLVKKGLIKVEKRGRGYSVYLNYQPATKGKMTAPDDSLSQIVRDEVHQVVRQEIRVGFVGLRSEILKHLDQKRESRYPLLQLTDGGTK